MWISTDFLSSHGSSVAFRCQLPPWRKQSKQGIRAPVPWDSGQPVGRGPRYVVRTPGKLSFQRFIGVLKLEATERFGHVLKIKIYIKLQGLASLDTLAIWVYLLAACPPPAGAEGLGLSTLAAPLTHSMSPPKRSPFTRIMCLGQVGT